jgi:hypothetical protein
VAAKGMDFFRSIHLPFLPLSLQIHPFTISTIIFGRKIVIFRVFYEVDEDEAEHALSLNNYHQDGDGDAPYHQ